MHAVLVGILGFKRVIVGEDLEFVTSLPVHSIDTVAIRLADHVVPLSICLLVLLVAGNVKFTM